MPVVSPLARAGIGARHHGPGLEFDGRGGDQGAARRNGRAARLGVGPLRKAAGRRGRKDNGAAGYEVISNHDPVQRNARSGAPLNLAGQQYTRGLYCHALSKLIVRLPSPGAKFSAVVGVDSNSDTKGGKGSVVFIVTADGKELFRTPTMHEGTKQSVNVELTGAKSFVLEASDAGDGIGHDQADWADAKVTLQDGKELWLGDMPEAGGAPPSRTGLPISFTLGGEKSTSLFRQNPPQHKSETKDDRVEHVTTWSDPRSGLQMRCVAVEYRDFPTIEWTVYFKNTGGQDTPILEDVRALDTWLARDKASEYVLHHNVGSPSNQTDYKPLTTRLPANAQAGFAPNGGRSSDPHWPYFNLAYDGGGLIVVVGWPGQWSADFKCDGDTGLHLLAGQQLNHYTLHPGEEVRTPLVVLQFWKGDRQRSQNIWRRWMMAHNVPRVDGKTPPSMLAACSSHQYAEMINANEENQKLFVDRYLAEGLKLDFWWMDAGWYINDGSWQNTGTWEVDPKRFPKGLRAVTDHAREKSVRSIVWFEPERVTGGTWLTKNHPEWIRGGAGGGLLDLGNDEARKWLIDHIDKLITDQGIDLYREDFNMEPLHAWLSGESGDRQGMSEMKHVLGHLAYWDAIKQRHPKIMIDSCASGGRRDDLETMRRAVPLLRSDHIFDPIGQQNHTYGIASWLPFYGTGLKANDVYSFRSQMTPFMIACYDMRDTKVPYEELRRLYGQWRSIGSLYFADYYPLGEYDGSDSCWMAWQFDSPEEGRGMVQAFRRHKDTTDENRYKLQGVEDAARYKVRSLDAPDQVTEMSGHDLLTAGLPIKTPPGSAVVLMYEKAP